MATKLSKEVQLLGDMARAFAESLNLELTLRAILKSLDTHVKLQKGTITLLDPETETINIKVAHGLSEKSKQLGSYKIGEGITGTVVQTGRESLCRIFPKTTDSFTKHAPGKNCRVNKQPSIVCP